MNVFRVKSKRNYFTIDLDDVSTVFTFDLTIHFTLKNGESKYLTFTGKEDFDGALKLLEEKL